LFHERIHLIINKTDMRLLFISVLLLFIANVMAQNNYVFVGTYTKGKSEGIYVYKINPADGSLTKVSSIKAENPSYLALSPDKKFLYAANENGNNKGGVTAFAFDAASGKLTKLNEQPSNGDHPCYVAVDNTGKWVAVGNYSGGNFSVYPVQENGSLGATAQMIKHSGSSANKSRQEGPHVHSVVFTPDNNYLVVTDLGTDKIMAYPFSAYGSKPVAEEANPQVSSTPGSGPRHLIFSKNLPVAYVIEEMSGMVAAYDVNNPEAPIQRINSHPADYKGAIGSAAIKISNDGKFLYASNRGESNTIAVFEINQTDGKLTSKGFIPAGGKAPRDFSIDPSDNYLLIANGNSDNITIYKRNKETGLVDGEGKKMDMPSPVCIVFY
jgi:6-phosphogluconolactonase